MVFQVLPELQDRRENQDMVCQGHRDPLVSLVPKDFLGQRVILGSLEIQEALDVQD